MFGRCRDFGDSNRQTIHRLEIEAAVSELLAEAVTPMALDLALAVQKEVAARPRVRAFRGRGPPIHFRSMPRREFEPSVACRTTPQTTPRVQIRCSITSPS
jgi:hypothetical protein